MDQSRAETIALQALAWIAATDDLLSVYLGATGASVDDIKTRAEDPDFLASVLDFLVMDDAWVVGFCDTSGTPYDAVLRARAALDSGSGMHWT